jgi:hypothetical protein
MKQKPEKFRIHGFKNIFFITVSLVIGWLCTPTIAADGPWEKRCGWFSNPTPSNVWLNDRDGEWTIGIQGGNQAAGDWPDFKPGEWVKTNVNYGYGCACMLVKVDHKSRQVLEMKSAYSRRLAACRQDRRLKEPK